MSQPGGSSIFFLPGGPCIVTTQDTNDLTWAVKAKTLLFFIILTPEACKSYRWLSLRMKCQRLSRSLHEHLGLLSVAWLSLPSHPSRFPPSLPPFFPLFNFLIPQRSPP